LKRTTGKRRVATHNEPRNPIVENQNTPFQRWTNHSDRSASVVPLNPNPSNATLMIIEAK
jgi:hypothetical protein